MTKTTISQTGINARAILLGNIANNPHAAVYCWKIIEQISQKMVEHHCEDGVDPYYLSAPYIVFGESFVNNYWFGMRKKWIGKRIQLNEALLKKNLNRYCPEVVMRSDEGWAELVHLHLWNLALYDQSTLLTAAIDKLKTQKSFSPMKLYRAQLVNDCLQSLIQEVRRLIENKRY